jgi:nucleoside-diphosphate-sugar epimerase
MSKGVVLISGVNGFIAASIAQAFLTAGYTVRGTVRSQKKGDQFVHAPAFKEAFEKGQLQTVVVEDITADGAFDEAVKGVDYFCHAASPLPGKHQGDTERDILIPALKGTTTAMRSAAKEPRIKKVVLLASVAGAIDYARPSQVGAVYDDTTWNTVPYEYAATTKDVFSAYSVSKTIAEKAAWDFVEKEKPTFKLTAINPSFVYGPAVAPLDPNSPFNGTNAFVSSLLLDPKYDYTPGTGYPNFVDVRDVAAAHVLAVEKDSANGHRFILSATEKIHPVDYPALIAKAAPELANRLPTPPSDSVPPETYTLDRSLSESVLGLKYHSVEVTLGDTARWVFNVSDSLNPRL